MAGRRAHVMLAWLARLVDRPGAAAPASPALSGQEPARQERPAADAEPGRHPLRPDRRRRQHAGADARRRGRADRHQTARLGTPIRDTIEAVTDRPVTTIINTHAHADHAGGNIEFPSAVEIIAQRTPRRDGEEGRFGPNAKFLPTTVTDQLSLLDGRDRIDIYYFGRGHTNGDLVVVFPGEAAGVSRRSVSGEVGAAHRRRQRRQRRGVGRHAPARRHRNQGRDAGRDRPRRGPRRHARSVAPRRSTSPRRA